MRNEVLPGADLFDGEVALRHQHRDRRGQDEQDLEEQPEVVDGEQILDDRHAQPPEAQDGRQREAERGERRARQQGLRARHGDVDEQHEERADREHDLRQQVGEIA